MTSPNIVRTSDMLQAFSDPVRVIPYGIDYEPYNRRRDSEVTAIRQQYGPRMVLNVGRLIYYKRFQYLISAMKEVDAKLLIAGEGPLREELERQFQAEGTKDRVEFLGEKTPEQLIPFNEACDIFALSSVRGETFGIVQLEAMAAGKPVVNTMLDSGRALWFHATTRAVTPSPRVIPKDLRRFSIVCLKMRRCVFAMAAKAGSGCNESSASGR